MSRPTNPMRIPHRAVTMLTGAVLSLSLLAGCDENGKFAMPLPKAGAKSSTAATAKTTTLVERDVEAPDVFSVTDQGLWDGRPSLGGVWVAHPDVTDPERVIIRNEANGKFVIGALFRRERDLPGPKLQISSDAAAALDVLAGAPAPLNVTALRREEADAPAPEDTAVEGTVAAPAEITETALDPIASAGAAIEEADPTPVAAAAEAAQPAAPAPRAPASNLSKPYVQLGIFSVETNAERTAKQMRGAGMVPSVRRSEINGKAFWRVLVGPATSASELDNLIKAIKAEGFSDAYAVAN